MPDLWHYEREAAEMGFGRIAGIDEAGRGPLAGPVVSAAVIFPRGIRLAGIDDSKKLSPKRRETLYHQIYDCAGSVGIGIVDSGEIDRINILRATLLSMRIAVENLSPAPEYLLIDGNIPIPVSLPQKSIPQGDGASASIAAASIVAKVTRDRLMERYHEEYPQYGFSQHKGYPTQHHKAAISRFGPCPIHRLSFAGVADRQCRLPLRNSEEPARSTQPDI